MTDQPLVTLPTIDATPRSVAGIAIPDSKLAREVTELVKVLNHCCCSTTQAASITAAR